MPDIILAMYPDYGSSDRLSNYSSIVTDRPEINDPGGHHIEGIFIAAGPMVKARPAPITGLKIEDIAPTVLQLMELPVPSDMDGRVITEAFYPDVMQAVPVQACPPMGRWPSEAVANVPEIELMPEEEEILRDRLRALGYLE